MHEKQIKELIVALDVFRRSSLWQQKPRCDLTQARRIILQFRIESHLSDRGFVDRCEQILWQNVTREAALNVIEVPMTDPWTLRHCVKDIFILSDLNADQAGARPPGQREPLQGAGIVIIDFQGPI